MIYLTTSLKNYSVEARDDGLGDGGPQRMEGRRTVGEVGHMGHLHSFPPLWPFVLKRSTTPEFGPNSIGWALSPLRPESDSSKNDPFFWGTLAPSDWSMGDLLTNWTLGFCVHILFSTNEYL